MKRLLIVTTRYPHANDKVSARFVFSQVEELKNHFEKIVVISTRSYIPSILRPFLSPKRQRDSLATNYSYDNVNVYFTKDAVIPVGEMKKKWAKQSYSSSKKILEKIGFAPDMIHAHRTWPPGHVAMMLSEEFGVPYIVTAHGYDAYGLPLKGDFWNKTVKESLEKASHVITVSSKTKKT